MSLTVKSALVIALQEDGTQRYVYQGSPLPASTVDHVRDRLLADGLVVDDTSTLGDAAVYPVSIVAAPDLQESKVESPGEGTLPARSASRHEWEQFAIRERGWTQAEADEVPSKAVLIERLGG